MKLNMSSIINKNKTGNGRKREIRNKVFKIKFTTKRLKSNIEMIAMSFDVMFTLHVI